MITTAPSRLLLLLLLLIYYVSTHWLQRFIAFRSGFRRIRNLRTVPPANATTDQTCSDYCVASGLQNLGNTCYLNSVLQGLYHCARFRKEILNSKSNTQDIVSVLHELFSTMKVGSLASNPRRLVAHLGVDPTIQEDAQEFYLKLIDKIHTDSTRRNTTHPPSELFTGQIENNIDCIHVNFTKSKRQKFRDLSLDLTTTNLKSALGTFLEPTILDGDNKYRTEAFGPQIAVKSARFSSLPSILTIQLNRFTYDLQLGDRVKVTSRLEFPLTLDMAPFIDHLYRSPEIPIVSVPSAAAPILNSIVHDSLMTSETGNTADVKAATLYDLAAVVVHIGSTDFGHYVTFARPDPLAKSEDWLKFDDDQVSKVSSDEVFSAAFGGTERISYGHRMSSDAYLLFYEKRLL